MTGPRYILEVWPHGWVFCAASGDYPGIPMTALSECQKLFPKKAVIVAGIGHHVRASGRRTATLAVAASKESAKKWETEIAAEIQSMPEQERWWKGLDVGASSAALFAVFCDDQFKWAAADYSRGAWPRDADDFGRCERLLGLFPQWRPRLQEVADRYPQFKWPAIVARWDEICAADAAQRNAILNEINNAKNPSQ